ncbi:helix-turn-helix domain-containing protein [Actinoallomurus liliacearum]|uniref:Helix-turn-helix domain-containing protein n=1 Tax=Actinoallomurus liliacearum TaxID=1080073 RepID=A0ABP8TYF9_9ACTN
MTGRTVALRPGLPISFDGEQFTVAEIEGSRVMLRPVGAPGKSAWRQVDVVALLSHPSIRILVQTAEPQPAVAAVLSASGEDDDVTARYRHVQEVRTGYQFGCPALALAAEPRPQFAAGVPMMARYRAKAAELGVGVSTVRRWVKQAEDGPVGLVAERLVREVLDRADPRWLDVARQVIAEHVNASRPVRSLILAEVEERLADKYGQGVVTIPSRTVGYELLRELDRGVNAFTGSTKAKRSIANRPHGAYGRLRATRPGEYVVVDTTRLDVFAMEPVTCRWVQAELTVAMDLYSRCITGLRLTPVSTKAIDIAGVLFETIHTRTRERRKESAALPYCGVPDTVMVDADKLVDARGRPLLPSVAAETIVVDHGKVYLSNHVKSVCARFGISIQPARPYTPTDKPVERWFKTLSEGLLAVLPGYKGPDVYSRGQNVEEQAFFFLNELEEIIREWIGLYHRCRHRGLVVPEFPGLQVSPLEMLQHGITRAGPLVIPTRPDMALEFLEVAYATIQHYGVEIDTLRYNSPALDDFRNRRSTLGGPHAGKWPIAIDSGDFSHVYFQDPRDCSWHELVWEHAAALGRPFSREAAAYARRLAARTHRFPDTKRALIDLLDRWGAGLTANRTERRMAVRLSQERLRLTGETITGPMMLAEQVTALPTVQRVSAQQRQEPTAADGVAELDGGDDDEDAECDAAFPGEEETVSAGEMDEDVFYADAWESR